MNKPINDFEEMVEFFVAGGCRLLPLQTIMDNAPDFNATENGLLANYFEKRVVSFFMYFTETKENFSVHSLHQMRVEVKKLRAFFRMLEMATANSFQKAEYLKLLAKIFKPGGRLRETQINLSLIEKYTSYQLPEYYLHLKKLEVKQTEKLKAAFNKVEIAQFDNLNMQIFPFLETIEINELEQELSGFISQELDAINTLRPGIYNDKKLHKLRMHLKALGYMTNLLNEMKPAQMLTDLNTSAKPTETLIGNWHDRIALIISLEKFLKKNPDTSDKSEIDRLIKQIKKKNGEAVEEISKRIDGLLVAREL